MASIITLSCLVGVVMFAFYAECDPVSIKLVDKADQVTTPNITSTNMQCLIKVHCIRVAAFKMAIMADYALSCTHFTRINMWISVMAFF